MLLRPTASDTAPEASKAKARTPVVNDNAKLLCEGSTPNSSEKIGSSA